MTIVDTVIAFVRNDRNRRLSYLVLAVISAILIFFPRPYVARAKIVPQDTSATAARRTRAKARWRWRSSDSTPGARTARA